MPTPTEILESLSRISNDGWFLALVWHALVSVGLLALATGARPSGRVVGLATSTLPASVSAMAFAYGNPFNGAVFALLAAALAGVAARADAAPITVRAGWAGALGAVLAAFGWLYPHFLDASPTAYLIAAPLGLVPCPTLSMMLGLALLGAGPAGRAWPALLLVAGAFYALVGAFRLGVWIDLIMLVGVLGLGVATWAERGRGLAPAPRAAGGPVRGAPASTP